MRTLIEDLEVVWHLIQAELQAVLEGLCEETWMRSFVSSVEKRDIMPTTAATEMFLEIAVVMSG